MKKVEMTPTEFVLFKQISNFFFNFAVSAGMVVVEASEADLAQLGY
jgi:hypothetical protein